MEQSNKRTESEMKAYIDGWNACYDRFLDYLRKNSKRDSVEKMRVIKAAVDGVCGKEGTDNGTD